MDWKRGFSEADGVEGCAIGRKMEDESWDEMESVTLGEKQLLG